MIGPANDVLRELRTLISASEQGSVTVGWSTAHGHRVVELTEPDASSGEAVATGDEPVDYVQVGGILPAPSSATAPKPDSPWTERASRAIGRALADAWKAARPQ